MKGTNVGLKYLFTSFFQIGLYSFGGYTSLISVLQQKMVQRDKVLDEGVVLDGLSIASILPGPLAVNIVTYVGYTLRGWFGALLSMIAVLLPSCLFMIAIAEFSHTFTHLPYVSSFLAGVMSVIVAVVGKVSFQMGKNHLKKLWQYVLVALVIGVSFFFRSYFVIISMIILGGILGTLFSDKENSKNQDAVATGFHTRLVVGLVGVFIFFVLLYLITSGDNEKILTVFTKVSLTLFGGGYVMIPALFDLVVDHHQWLSVEEFSNAITFGQITPGPILVSATYVGYQVNGIIGAVLATIGIFLPSATLMVVVGSGFIRIKDYAITKKIMAGIRPVVIGLIGYSVILLLKGVELPLITSVLSVVSFALLTFGKVNFFIVLLVFGLIGMIVF